ncbi:hypothetical protein [Hyphomicrobium sp. NDB2Meth4]|uniref:hypothetical protein n=1 Tax=Hyphomicrobium sp. NDB2Meth4 TaxID=1892846 RepID=UPI000930101B|nr:hypothetical protein [Hyphomicrobium sp. NDB2Meth4]
MRVVIVAVLFALSSIAMAADTPSVEFGNETFSLGFEDQRTLPDGQPGNGLAEFTLPGESVDNWSKLFAFYSYPEMNVDPVTAVEAVGKAVKESNKDANYAIVTNDKGEAIIDFLTWAPDSDVMEFNVFKYAPAADGRGLVAMQYAQHVKLGDTDVEQMRELRATSVADMAATDIDQAQKYFAAKRARSASAGEPSTLARAGRTR